MLACLLACLLAWSGKKTICGGSGGSPACDAAAFSFVLPPSFSCLFGPVSRFLAAPQALLFVSPPVRRRAQKTLFRYPRQLKTFFPSPPSALAPYHWRLKKSTYLFISFSIRGPSTTLLCRLKLQQRVLRVFGGLLPTREHQSTPKRAHIEEAAQGDVLSVILSRRGLRGSLRDSTS